MTQAYRDPTRERDPFALPDIEVFYVDAQEAAIHTSYSNPTEPGWYWWACFPGCLPDGDPFGPFATEAEALANAQEDY